MSNQLEPHDRCPICKGYLNKVIHECLILTNGLIDVGKNHMKKDLDIIDRERYKFGFWHEHNSKNYINL